MAGMFSMTEVVLDLSPFVKMTPAEFERFCQANPDVVAELNAEGEVEIMSPVKRDSSRFEAILIGEMYAWNKHYQLGELGSSSGGYILPNQAVRVPDASWYSLTTLQLAASEADSGLPKLVPEFVAEIRSDSDRMARLQAKMEEYRSVGVQLGWLLDPDAQTAWVYRPGAAIEEIDLRAQPILSGEPVLVGFAFDTRLFTRG